MKLCIPVATADGLNAALEPDFGAARHLIVLDSEGEGFHALDRANPESISPEVVAGIEGIFCGEIHPRLLFELQQNGIEVFACEAASAADALAQFRAGALEAAPLFSLPPEMSGGCGCGHSHGEHQHEHGEHAGGCCGGGGHGEDHECCGGKGHGGEGCGCGGEGKHAHEHGQGGCGGHGNGGCGCQH